MITEIDWKEETQYDDLELSIPDVENNVAWYALGQRLSRQFKNQKSKMSTALADAYIKYKPKKALRDKIKASFPDIIVHDIKTLQPEIYEMDEVNYAEEHIVTFSNKKNLFNRMRINASFLAFNDSDEDDDLTYDESFAERARVINMFLDLLPEEYKNGLEIEDDEVYEATKDLKIEDYEMLSADSEWKWNWMFYLVALVYIGNFNKGEVVTKKTFFDECLKVIGGNKLSKEEQEKNEKRTKNKGNITKKININKFTQIDDPIIFKQDKKKKREPAAFYRVLLAYKRYKKDMEVEDAVLPGISTFALLLVVPKSKNILVIIEDNSKKETVDIKEVVERPVVA